jgi:hypothetical protein
MQLELQTLRRGKEFSTILANGSRGDNILFQVGKSSHALGCKLHHFIKIISNF